MVSLVVTLKANSWEKGIRKWPEASTETEKHCRRRWRKPRSPR